MSDKNTGNNAPPGAPNPQSPDWDAGQPGGAHGDETPPASPRPKPTLVWENPDMKLAAVLLLTAGVAFVATRNFRWSGAAASAAGALAKTVRIL